MKNYLRLTLFVCLLPMLTMAEKVPYSCGEGNAFTIRIPVRIPASMSVEYVWYRNDTVVKVAPLTAGVTAIAYTIPANKAFGSSVAYHFKYRVDCDEEWLLSPRYLITFLACPTPQVSAIAGDAVVCAGTSVTYSAVSSPSYAADVFYAWIVPLNWAITAGQNTGSIRVIAGTANGFISVMSGNSCGLGATHTLAVSNFVIILGAISVAIAAACNGISHAGAISVAAAACNGDIADVGAIDVFPAASCDSGIVDAGTISVSAAN